MVFIDIVHKEVYSFFCGVNVDVLKWAPRFRDQIANIDFNSTPYLGQICATFMAIRSFKFVYLFIQLCILGV